MMQNYLIDFAVLWVDGNDPEWRKQKEFYAGKSEKNDAREFRYRDWDIFRYWFRSVEKFAPWVNKVYVITCGHAPEWLDLSSEKLCFVKHSDYMPSEYLPTFNSNPIELNLHRIKGLQEHFVYFNDDMFLTQPLTPDFFFKEGIPMLYGGIEPFKPVECGSFTYILLNDMNMINRHFSPRKMDKETRKKLVLPSNELGIKQAMTNRFLLRYDYYSKFGDDHMPTPVLKSTIEKLWEVEGTILDETSRHRFRDKGDVNQYIFRYWQLASGQFYQMKKSKRGKFYNVRPSKYQKACRAIENQTYPIICLNDTDDAFTEVQIEEIKQAFNAAFTKILPDKSSFER